MQWIRDLAVEAWFEQHAIPVRWEDNIPLSKIDVNSGPKNQSRPEGIDTDVVTQYACNMLDSTAFPGLVFWKRKGVRPYKIAQGNHRLAAYVESGLAAGTPHVSGYVIDTEDDSSILIATRALNVLNGLPLSNESRIRQAVSLVEEFPSAKRAKLESMFGLKRGSISKELRRQDVRNTLAERRIKPGKLGVGMLDCIGTLRGNEMVMAETADIVVNNNLTTDEVAELVAEVKKRKTERTQRAAIAAYEEQLERHKPTPISRQAPRPCMAFVRKMRDLLAYVHKYPTLQHMEFPSKADAENAREDWLNVQEAVKKVLGK